MSYRDMPASKEFSHSTDDVSPSPSPSRRQERAKTSKAHPGLTRATSSLDVMTTFQAFKTSDEPENTENDEMDCRNSSEVTKIRQSYCPTTPTRNPRARIDDNEYNSATESLLQSFSDGVMAPEAHQEALAPYKYNENLNMATEGVPKEIMEDISSSKTFYGGIHKAYNNSCRELNARFGEVEIEALRSKTKREVCQVELLHLLAISTDDPGTYYSSIKRVRRICKSMSNRLIAENLWEKTRHITYELDEDFKAKKQAAANSSPAQAHPLSTIDEEDDGPDNNLPNSNHPDYHQSDNRETNSRRKSLSAPAFSRSPTPTPSVENDKYLGHHNDAIPGHTRRTANPTTHHPELNAEHLARTAHEDYVNMLRIDILRRQEATDRYVANLEDDIAARKYATDQYIAELEERVRKLG